MMAKSFFRLSDIKPFSYKASTNLMARCCILATLGILTIFASNALSKLFQYGDSTTYWSKVIGESRAQPNAF